MDTPRVSIQYRLTSQAVDTMDEQIRVGDIVVALVTIAEVFPDGEKLLHAEPGAIGTVIDMGDDYSLRVRWQATGTVYDAEPGTEIRRFLDVESVFARSATKKDTAA